MKKLTKEQHHILIEKGTEIPFTGKLLKNKEKGVYVCAACRNKLFVSETKYDSGTGWPSFYDADKKAVKLKEDNNMLTKRIEVVCSKCNGHLGHVFDDGPKPTGKRYCINSVALEFKKEKTNELSWKEVMLKKLKEEEPLTVWAVKAQRETRKNRYGQLKKKA